MLEFAAAYIITITLETAIALLLLKGRYDEKLIVRNSVIASSITLPFVWFVFPNTGLYYSAWLAIAEIFALIAEAGFYRALFPKMGWADAARLSFICNLASFVAGIAL